MFSDLFYQTTSRKKPLAGMIRKIVPAPPHPSLEKEKEKRE